MLNFILGIQFACFIFIIVSYFIDKKVYKLRQKSYEKLKESIEDSIIKIWGDLDGK